MKLHEFFLWATLFVLGALAVIPMTVTFGLPEWRPMMTGFAAGLLLSAAVCYIASLNKPP
jgi:hypothetical protein